MKSIYLNIPDEGLDNNGYVLATVTGTSGSTPQKPGSSALFSKSRLVAGTVGGGILEAKVQKTAIESSVHCRSGHYSFTLDNTAVDGEDSLCGGKIRVLVDASLQKHSDVFRSIKDSIRRRQGGVLITRIIEDSNGVSTISRLWITETTIPAITGFYSQQVEKLAVEMIGNQLPGDFREIKSPSNEANKSDLFFLESIVPSPRLLIAGAGHIGKALAKLGQMLDFEVTIVDDRAEFANKDNIPWADHIIEGNIGYVIANTLKGKDLYIVIVTRGHRNDAEALKGCIGTDSAYIGMIGSKRKVALMKKEFIEMGWATMEQWSKIYAPIGLDINSRTVEEIAISIAAQIIKIKNKI